jgi:AraC-like DNA-binding protein
VNASDLHANAGYSQPPKNLIRLSPPYSSADVCDAGEVANNPLGTVLILDIASYSDSSRFEEIACTLRRSHPAVSLAARMSNTVNTSTLRVASAALKAGVPVLSCEQAPPADQLRAALTDSSTLGDDLCAWLAQTGLVDNREVLDFVMSMATAPSIGHDHSNHSVAWSRATRIHCSRQHVPAPVKWRVFVRTLYQMISVQRAPRVSCSHLAYELGFPDQQDMCHAFRNHFGATPTQIKGRIGWHWAAYYWAHKHFG